MSLDAIYACKLYKASRNKHRIHAAVDDPINKELVQQLSEYLDDEYLKKAQQNEAAQRAERDAQKANESEDKEEQIRPSKSSSSGSKGGSSFSGGGMDTHLSDKLKDEGSDDDFTFDDAVDKGGPSNEEGQVEESTKISRAPVTASCHKHINLTSELNSIIGLVNSTEDTAGVCRGAAKENELWLHYKDSINLNNVMEPVIALLNASNYSMLDFNRLARTENAIVFSS